jgi:hypothetical protein
MHHNFIVPARLTEYLQKHFIVIVIDKDIGTVYSPVDDMVITGEVYSGFSWHGGFTSFLGIV